MNCLAFLKKLIDFYVWLRWVFAAAQKLSLIAESKGCSLLQSSSFSLQWLVAEHGLEVHKLSSCGTLA